MLLLSRPVTTSENSAAAIRLGCLRRWHCQYTRRPWLGIWLRCGGSYHGSSGRQEEGVLRCRVRCLIRVLHLVRILQTDALTLVVVVAVIRLGLLKDCTH